MPPPQPWKNTPQWYQINISTKHQLFKGLPKWNAGKYLLEIIQQPSLPYFYLVGILRGKGFFADMWSLCKCGIRAGKKMHNYWKVQIFANAHSAKSCMIMQYAKFPPTMAPPIQQYISVERRKNPILFEKYSELLQCHNQPPGTPITAATAAPTTPNNDFVITTDTIIGARNGGNNPQQTNLATQ